MSLIKDVAIYLSALGLNKTLAQAIIDGDFSGSGPSSDTKVKASGTDTTAGDLSTKIVGTSGRTSLTLLNAAGDESVQIDIGADVALLNSPSFTGNPTVPTQTQLNGSTRIANTQYTDTAVLNAKQKIAYIRDEKAAATQGGTATAASLFAQRVLNTLSGDTSFITLTANRFTLQPGTYEIDAVVPAYLCNAHKSLLRSVTASANILIGSAAYSNTTSGSASESLIRGQFTIASATEYEIQTRVSLDRATVGYGIANNMGVPEVYTQVKITKIS